MRKLQTTLKHTVFLMILGFLLPLNLSAQNTKADVIVALTCDKPDWIYKVGDKPKFKITAKQNGQPANGVKVKYEIGPEKMPVFKSDFIELNNGEATIDSYSLKEPGFLRLTVTSTVAGKQVKSLITAAFDPQLIKPTVTMPNDFNSFWDKAKRELAQVPVDPQLELLKDRSTANVDVYQLSIQNIGKSRIYGTLCVPKKAGKYPAILKVPGAGVRPYPGDVYMAEKGFITLDIGIHGIPVNLSQPLYDDLKAGALSRYPNYDLDNKDKFYYKRVYLGCLRAVDYLISNQSFDGENIAVIGGSQGGALSIVTASLDKRIKYLVSYYPALSDLTGYLNNRAGGWPHYLNSYNISGNNSKEKLETMRYYDVVNFAKNITTPGFYTWGFNDETCPPTSTYAAYNSITAPKELTIYKETGHATIPEQRTKMNGWLISKLKK